MFYLYFLEKKTHYSPSNRFSKHKTFPNFFLSCYSSSLNLENTVATLYPYFILKNCPMVLIYYSFSLIQMFFLLSIVLLGFSSEYINATPSTSSSKSLENHLWQALPASSNPKPISTSFFSLFLRSTWRQPHQIDVVFVERWLLR